MNTQSYSAVYSVTTHTIWLRIARCDSADPALSGTQCLPAFNNCGYCPTVNALRQLSCSLRWLMAGCRASTDSYRFHVLFRLRRDGPWSWVSFVELRMGSLFLAEFIRSPSTMPVTCDYGHPLIQSMLKAPLWLVSFNSHLIHSPLRHVVQSIPTHGLSRLALFMAGISCVLSITTQVRRFLETIDLQFGCTGVFVIILTGNVMGRRCSAANFQTSMLS